MLGVLRLALRPVEAECPECKAGEQTVVTDLVSRLRVTSQKLIGLPPLAILNLWCKKCNRPFHKIERGPRRVIGYHGCDRIFAESLLHRRTQVANWTESENVYDWIGKGVYFWEDAPGRAWQWARQRHKKNPAVVAAEITLGQCVDLGDTGFVGLLALTYQEIKRSYGAKTPPETLPKNEPLGGKRGEPDDDLKLRKLDRLVIDNLVVLLESNGVSVQTVRAPFEEGTTVYEGARIRSQSHVQIAVRDRKCIGSTIWLIPEVAS